MVQSERVSNLVEDQKIDCLTHERVDFVLASAGSLEGGNAKRVLRGHMRRHRAGTMFMPCGWGKLR